MGGGLKKRRKRVVVEKMDLRGNRGDREFGGAGKDGELLGVSNEEVPVRQGSFNSLGKEKKASPCHTKLACFLQIRVLPGQKCPGGLPGTCPHTDNWIESSDCAHQSDKKENPAGNSLATQEHRAANKK